MPTKTATSAPVNEPSAAAAEPSAPALSPTTRVAIEIDRGARRASLGGHEIKLGGRAFDLLATLAEHPGRVFSVDELIAAVWRGRVVEENNLRVQIAELRKRLGAALIVNVAGRGYVLASPGDGLATPRRRHNLPHWADALLGRDDDLAALAQLQAGHRLITVLGAGGIGKTRLAQALARRLLEVPGACADGVWWVDLAALTSGSQVCLAIAQACDLQTAALDAPDAARHLGHALAGRDSLLVLDNAEHLVAELAPLLHTLLQAAPTLQLLVTSQQPLHIGGEQAYRLDALAVPAPAASAAEARRSPALQLLERRARAADQRFAFSDAALPGAAALCRQLDGIALALEMAGARLPVLGLGALNERLGERLRLLAGDADATPPRHRTLHAALDWSHSLLSVDEQAVLRRLSVFAAPFRLDAAQQVAADTALPEQVALQAIFGLVDKSLLQVQGGEPRRYRLLESTRLYAAQALARHGETAAFEARHARAMAALAERAQAAFWHTTDVAWLDEWQADHDDWLLAFDRACALGDADAAAPTGEAVHCLAHLNGVHSAMRQRLPQTLAMLPLAGPRSRAMLTNRLGLDTVAGPAIVRNMQQRVAAWREVGDPMALARALAGLAIHCEKAGDRAGSDDALAQLRALDDPAWPPRLRAWCVPCVLSWQGMQRGDAALLRSATLQFIDLCRAAGWSRQLALANTDLAHAERLDGKLPAAVAQLRRAAAELGALGCNIDAGVALSMLCEPLLAQGQHSAARDAAEQALLSFGGDAESLRHLLEPLALLACRLQRPADGARAFGAALALREQLALRPDPVSRRVAAEVHAALAAALDPAQSAALQAAGARLDAAGLRDAALVWLRAAR